MFQGSGGPGSSLSGFASFLSLSLELDERDEDEEDEEEPDALLLEDDEVLATAGSPDAEREDDELELDGFTAELELLERGAEDEELEEDGFDEEEDEDLLELDFEEEEEELEELFFFSSSGGAACTARYDDA